MPNIVPVRTCRALLLLGIALLLLGLVIFTPDLLRWIENHQNWLTSVEQSKS